jgi:hypothetical protein
MMPAPIGRKRLDSFSLADAVLVSTLDAQFPRFAMEATKINLQLYDLTGQVSIVDGIARFNGNYSSVLLGTFRGQYVRRS